MFKEFGLLKKDINNLMVQFAKQGKLVLRLKGGDASLFSNILDELQILKTPNFYEIIPEFRGFWCCDLQAFRLPLANILEV
jgi:siroheme synthase